MLNKTAYILVLLVLIAGCRPGAYLLIKDPGLYLKDDCNHQENLKRSTGNKLFRKGITLSKKTAVHIQVLFHGKENRCIVLVNCNAGFQGPRYLGFYNGSTLKIIRDSFDLSLLYEEYLSFCKQNDPANRDKIWEYIDTFSRTELFYHYNQVNF